MKNIILKQGGALLCAMIAVFTLNLFVWAQGPEVPEEPQIQVRSEPRDMEIALFDELTQEYIPISSPQTVGIVLEGEELHGDVPAFLYEERTLFPLRLVSEALGATVEWEEETRSALVTGEEITLVFTLGSPTALVNGEERELPDGVSPCLASVLGEERTMVPLRFLAESLDFQVEWEDATKTVYLAVAQVPEEPKGSLSGFRVALDAGHGGSLPGAVYENICEKDITLPIILRVAELLEEKGCKVTLTREDDSSVGLYERCDIANEAGADIFVSVHVNASEVKTFQGTFTYFYPGSKEGKALAQVVQDAVIQAAGSIDRGIISEDFVVLRETRMPAALVETGFMTCHEELLRLCDPEYQEKLAQGVAQGIEDYLTK